MTIDLQVAFQNQRPDYLYSRVWCSYLSTTLSGTDANTCTMLFLQGKDILKKNKEFSRNAKHDT